MFFCVFDYLHGCVYSAYQFPGMQTRTLAVVVVLDGEENESPKSGNIVP